MDFLRPHNYYKLCSPPLDKNFREQTGKGCKRKEEENFGRMERYCRKRTEEPETSPGT